MAAKARFNAESLKHKEDFYILPQDIIIDERLNFRFRPHSEAEVIDRAYNMLEHGQLQPSTVRKAHDEDGKAKLVFGFLRAKAALYINQVLLPAGGGDYKGKHYDVTEAFPLWVGVQEGNELQSAIRNVVENLERKGTTIMDMVVNQEKLRKMGQTDDRIAEIYRMEKPQVVRYSKLLALNEQVQSYIHEGVISADAGFLLLELPEDEQVSTVQGLLDDAKAAGRVYEHSEQAALVHVPTGSNPKYKGKASAPAETPAASEAETPTTVVKVKTSAIKNAVREKKQAAGSRGPTLNLAEFKKIVKEIVDTATSDVLKELFKKQLALIAGDITVKQFDNAIEKATGEKVVREKPEVEEPAPKTPKKKNKPKPADAPVAAEVTESEPDATDDFEEDPNENGTD